MTTQDLPAYESESALVDDFVAGLTESPGFLGVVRYACEFDYRRGRTDVIAVSSEGAVVAFEAKLTRWRDALHQAYRNLCFANYSYVVVPRDVAVSAQRFAGEFEKRRVGLCYVEGAEVVILQEAKHCQPLLPWLTRRALTAVSSGGDA